MKLKYKKIIMLTAMSTMGIGLLTLSISQERPRAEVRYGVEESKEANSTIAQNVTEDNSTSDEMNDQMNIASSDQINMAQDTDIIVTMNIPTSTPIPEPTAAPIYKLEKESKYPEIKSLFIDYYAAKQNCDTKKLKTMLSDPTKVESQELLQSRTEYIDDYRNIKSYIKKGYLENSYIVYVYHEIKFTSVNTPAPGLAKFYVIQDDNNDLKIFSGVMDEALKVYYDARNADEDIVELIKMTEDKSKSAKAKDEDLSKFWKDVDKLANKSKQESKTENSKVE